VEAFLGVGLGGSEICGGDSSFTRVSMAIPFTFQVLPRSSENASSKRHEPGVMFHIRDRKNIARPFSFSWKKNSPRPFLNSPIMGLMKVPSLLVAK
jgi:hypothetical protein